MIIHVEGETRCRRLTIDTVPADKDRVVVSVESGGEGKEWESIGAICVSKKEFEAAAIAVIHA